MRAVASEPLPAGGAPRRAPAGNPHAFPGKLKLETWRSEKTLPQVTEEPFPLNHASELSERIRIGILAAILQDAGDNL